MVVVGYIMYGFLCNFVLFIGNGVDGFIFDEVSKFIVFDLGGCCWYFFNSFLENLFLFILLLRFFFEVRFIFLMKEIFCIFIFLLMIILIVLSILRMVSFILWGILVLWLLMFIECYCMVVFLGILMIRRVRMVNWECFMKFFLCFFLLNRLVVLLLLVFNVFLILFLCLFMVDV